MRHLDLFSGIGGFALAAKWTWGDEYENVGHSEIEKFPCKVYHKHFPESECLGDITKIDWERFKGKVDLLTGGFPCQPHSIAGKRKASKDERDLWGECVRTLRGVRPRYALFENVPGLLISENGRFFNAVLTDIHESRYDAEWQIISAADVGAPHLRERVWIVAYPEGKRDNGRGIYKNCQIRKRGILSGECDNGDEVRSTIGTDNAEASRNNSSDSNKDGWRRRGHSSKGVSSRAFTKDKIESRGGGTSETGGRESTSGWSVYEPTWKENWVTVATRLCRMDDGLSDRVDRIRGCGNSISPQVAQVIMEAIKQFDSPQPER